MGAGQDASSCYQIYKDRRNQHSLSTNFLIRKTLNLL
uniref:Uncharacterized protein n=1 Tax=Vitis vinifera TaxID=29760 RepID=F6HSW9_VITVI